MDNSQLNQDFLERVWTATELSELHPDIKLTDVATIDENWTGRMWDLIALLDKEKRTVPNRITAENIMCALMQSGVLPKDMQEQHEKKVSTFFNFPPEDRFQLFQLQLLEQADPPSLWELVYEANRHSTKSWDAAWRMQLVFLKSMMTTLRKEATGEMAGQRELMPSSHLPLFNAQLNQEPLERVVKLCNKSQ